MTKPNACSVCDCIPPKYDKDFAQQAVLNVACNILGAISTGGLTGNHVDLSIAGNTSGTKTLISSGTAILVGGNNITLSQNGQSITISANAELGVDLSISGNTSGTSALIASGTAILAGGNNITLSQNGQSVTISAASQTVQTQNLVDVSISGNTSGTKVLVSSGTLILAGGNNITLSQNGQSITISGANTAAGIGTLNRFMPYGVSGVGPSDNASLQFVWMTVPAQVEFDRIMSHMSFSISSSSNSSFAGNISCYIGIYTKNISTLSLLVSTSTLVQFSEQSGGSIANLSGWRHVSLPLVSTLTAGEYWMGLHSKTSTTNANWFTASNMVAFNQLANSVFNGTIGATAASEQIIPGWGYYSGSTTLGNPANSIAFSDIGRHLGGDLRSNPVIVFANGTV